MPMLLKLSWPQGPKEHRLKHLYPSLNLCNPSTKSGQDTEQPRSDVLLEMIGNVQQAPASLHCPNHANDCSRKGNIL